MVVSRCRLSSTTFNLNSAVYCLRFFSMGSNTFHFGPFPCSSVHYTRYWTSLRVFWHSLLQEGLTWVLYRRWFHPNRYLSCGCDILLLGLSADPELRLILQGMNEVRLSSSSLNILGYLGCLRRLECPILSS